MKKLTQKDTKPVFDANDNLIEFTIKREKWGKNALLSAKNDVEQACCLGHLGIACGIPKNKMIDSGILSVCGSYVSQNFKGIGFLQKNRTETTLTSTNDADKGAPYSKPESKEKRITEIFAKHGIKVNFV